MNIGIIRVGDDRVVVYNNNTKHSIITKYGIKEWENYIEKKLKYIFPELFKGWLWKKPINSMCIEDDGTCGKNVNVAFDGAISKIAEENDWTKYPFVILEWCKEDFKILIGYPSLEELEV